MRPYVVVGKLGSVGGLIKVKVRVWKGRGHVNRLREIGHSTVKMGDPKNGGFWTVCRHYIELQNFNSNEKGAPGKAKDGSKYRSVSKALQVRQRNHVKLNEIQHEHPSIL